MAMADFIKFPKIENINKIYMSITQKIHGTNGQIYIEDLESGNCGSEFIIKAGSRTRWLTVNDDNHGFAKWVKSNEIELYSALGPGRHYGEWCGKGINAGEGLSEKMFVLFNYRRYKDKILDPHLPYLMDRVRTVPVIYTGEFSLEVIDNVMNHLKNNGSYLTPPGWYMKPEGIVIEVANTFYKKVFDDEEIAWKKPVITRSQLPQVDVNHLLQPIRLEKLLSSDERYIRNYPETLSDIAKAYSQDLVDEGQITGTEDEVRAIRKSLGAILYKFIRHQIENKNE